MRGLWFWAHVDGRRGPGVATIEDARQGAVNDHAGRDVPPEVVPSTWEAIKEIYELRRHRVLPA